MFHIGDKVLYPMHGAGIIEAIEEREILGNKQLYYVMSIRSMQVMFPMDTILKIRPIVDSDVVDDVITNFHDGESDTSLNPNQRYRCNMNKIRTGDIYQGAEVIRDLIRMSKKRALSTGDKAMLDNAQQILISEVILAKGIPQEQALDLFNQVVNN
ncbi:CarD family transcriptional regulator [Desulforamulus aeronauticus]|uniref:Transcriptional regulator, CarD family n=1 Tax=Desulforamulus aeronauticus DSM 10349 TaxID=1121421 RepID=A0A1M6SYW1_9FIRM|nr:CarD family transcriptional regulator [Desulforamulus aeronauticus]SHK49903.1 transcriptional regulator, CarD family [Desulforamulus aeronauticus DSM 10349]